MPSHAVTPDIILQRRWTPPKAPLVEKLKLKECFGAISPTYIDFASSTCVQLVFNLHVLICYFCRVGNVCRCCLAVVALRNVGL